MDFLSGLQRYFAAERDLGLVLAGAGLGALVFAWHVWRTQTGAFQVGVLIPLLLIGLGATAGGAGLAARSAKQSTELAARYQQDPAGLAVAELGRMARVNANWPKIKVVWAVISVLSLAVIFGLRREGATGAAVILLFTAGLLMIVDTFAERRAMIYTAHLEALREGAGRGGG